VIEDHATARDGVGQLGKPLALTVDRESAPVALLLVSD
jgi:hypothetical protein